MENKEKLTHASYLEYEATIFGACGIALGLGALLAAYIQSVALWLILLGAVVHSWGMYKIHKRNK